MEALKLHSIRGKRRSPRAHAPQLFALTGHAGAGVATIARLLCREHGAIGISMDSIPRLAREMSLGRHTEGKDAHWALIDYRLEGERGDEFHWLRPFHRRLKTVLRQRKDRPVVITGILTPREVAYCRMMGARMIHLFAPEAIRRRRIGLRFPDPPHPSAGLVERLAESRPELWNLIVDSDEPFADFIQSFKAQLSTVSSAA